MITFNQYLSLELDSERLKQTCIFFISSYCLEERQRLYDLYLKSACV